MVRDLTIVIVTLNAETTLQRCLDSIYRQHIADIKIIIIDGDSSDDTKIIIKANSNRLYYWESEPDSGIYDAMNKALKYLTSDWVYFLGADDQLLPEFSMFIESLKEPLGIYYANVLAGGEKRLGYLSRYQIAKFGIYHQAMIFPVSLFKNLKYEVKYRISADYAFILTVAGMKGIKFIYKNFIIADYSQSGISGKQVDLVFQRAKPSLILKNFGLLSWLRFKIHKRKNMHNPRA